MYVCVNTLQASNHLKPEAETEISHNVMYGTPSKMSFYTQYKKYNTYTMWEQG